LPTFDSNHKSVIDSVYTTLHELYDRDADFQPHHLHSLTEETISEFINTTKDNKAADCFGIACEHLKYGHPAVQTLLTNIFNQIIATREIPTQFKHGVITPVFKKKESDKNPDNYRRITVTSTVGKVFEKVLVAPTKEILKDKLNKLQRGFCAQASSINTAFLISEAIAEARDCKHTLFASFLDASKAFDVVFHKSMLVKLHQLGVTGDLWQLYCSLYDGMSSQVK
jgi:hypothetical protein